MINDLMSNNKLNIRINNLFNILIKVLCIYIK